MTEASDAPEAAPTGWFYLHPGTKQTYGPFDEAALVSLAEGGYLSPSLLFTKSGATEWRALGEISELSDVVSHIKIAIGDGTEGQQQEHTSDHDGPPAKRQRGSGIVSSTAVIGKQAETISAVDRDILRFQSEVASLTGAQLNLTESAEEPEEKEFVDDDGTRYVWSAREGRYVPGGEVAAGKAPEYTEEDMVFDAAALSEEPKAASKKGQTAEEKKEGKKEGGKTTAVYVQGLPDDATEEELAQVFSRCGIIKEDEDRTPKVKVYRDAEGKPKGDGLVVFLKRPSVDLALQLLDGASFREGWLPIKVQEASFSHKPSAKPDKGGAEGKPKGKVIGGHGKKKKKNATQEQLLHWAGDDNMQRPQDTVMVLENVFLAEDMVMGVKEKKEAIAQSLKKDMGRFGRVDRVRVFHQHPDGVCTVKFIDADDANKAQQALNGTRLGGRVLRAYMWDGKRKFAAEKVQETEEDELRRLEAFSKELEGGGLQGERTAAREEDPYLGMEDDGWHD